MITAGVDIGSSAVKALVLEQENGRILGHAVLPSGWDHKKAFEEALSYACAEADVSVSSLLEEGAVTVTGYGRTLLKGKVHVLSEITCHAKGASFLFPEASGVVDIGGQDSKAVRLGAGGAVEDFIMNDKCAAGTGRFIQMTATLLGMDMEAFSRAARQGKPAKINSMCAVFAESEIVGLLARAVSPEDIAAGVLFSVSERTGGMVRRLGLGGSFVFSGGLAASPAMAEMLSRSLGKELLVPPFPQLTGALGAALLTDPRLVRNAAHAVDTAERSAFMPF